MSSAWRMLCAAALTLTALAARADQAIDIASGGAGVFHHLEASGRHSLAVSSDVVALTWEDNRHGAPRCYLAVRAGEAGDFREFSFGAGECFEPGIAPMAGGRLLLIWEDEDGVHAALAGVDGVGAPLRLAAQGGQGALTFHAELGAFAAWSAPAGRWRQLWLAPLAVESGALRAGAARPLDAAPPADDQMFPSLASVGAHLVVAWEDRRLGHTVIFTSRSADGSSWSPPARLSRNPTGKQAGDLGRGSGAMRPALATFGARLAAVWLDKRDFLSGYDVYAALSDDGGASFGADTRAQDSFGDAIAQWHAAAAGNARGDLLIAWDDDRDGTADIWLTTLEGDGYGEDFTLAAISGPARQTDPAVALDDDGNLHLAWTQREADGSSRLRYLRRAAGDVMRR